MRLLIIIVSMFLTSSCAQEDERTRMVVVDEGSRTAYRVEVGRNPSDATVETFSMPELKDLTEVDYDFIEDRLYILTMHSKITSVFVNGTGSQLVMGHRGSGAHSLAVDPRKRLIFISVYNEGLYSMNMDGSDKQLVVNRTGYAKDLAADYEREFLYWAEYPPDCPCLFKVDYNGRHTTEVRNIYMSIGGHAVDFRNQILYGDGPRGLHKFYLQTREEVTYRRPVRHWATVTVYDPKTDRLFITNDAVAGTVQVYSVNGTRLGRVGGLSLTRDKLKRVRFNPL